MNIWNRFFSYLRLSNTKLFTWSVLLIPYVAIMIFYSGALPRWVQKQIQEIIYTSSVSLASILPTPTPMLGVRQITSADTDPEVLTIGYFLVTYLWSCILVESFGTIRGLHRRRHDLTPRRGKQRQR